MINNITAAVSDYFKGYTGNTCQAHYRPVKNKIGKTHTGSEERIRRLEREVFSLWNFVWQEGLGDEAREFVEEHRDEETPFAW